MNSENENDYNYTDDTLNMTGDAMSDVENNNSPTEEVVGAAGGCLLAIYVFFGKLFKNMQLPVLNILTIVSMLFYAVIAIVSFVLSIAIPSLLGLFPFVCFTVVEMFIASVCIIMSVTLLNKSIDLLKANKHTIEDAPKQKICLPKISRIVSIIGLITVLICLIFNVIDFIAAVF